MKEQRSAALKIYKVTLNSSINLLNMVEYKLK